MGVLDKIWISTFWTFCILPKILRILARKTKFSKRLIPRFEPKLPFYNYYSTLTSFDRLFLSQCMKYGKICQLAKSGVIIFLFWTFKFSAYIMSATILSNKIEPLRKQQYEKYKHRFFNDEDFMTSETSCWNTIRI